MTSYDSIRSTEETDDDFVREELYPLKTWRWHDAGEQP